MATQKLKIQSGQRPNISMLNPQPPPPPPPVDDTRADSSDNVPYFDREYGLPAVLNTVQDARKAYAQLGPAAGRAIGNFFSGTTPSSVLAAQSTGSGSSARETIPVLAQRPEETVQEDPFTTFMSQFAGQPSGGGAAAPDYSAYRASLTDQAQQINAQIQAMYNQLGESAGENVARLEDIYGGAQAGIGDIYGSAAANTADAYGSSQQQAADQLARLGIEAAAPAVVDPMALSQAEALSGLEAGKAGGQAAAERYGATAGGFGSQMAQVAQQQGTEMNSAVLSALQNRLNDTLLMEEQGRQAAASSGGGGADPMSSAMDFLRLQEMFYAPQVAGQEMQLRAAQIAADNTLSERDKLLSLAEGYRRDFEPEDAMLAAEEDLRRANASLGIR